MNKEKTIYKNEITGDLVILKDDYFHFFDGECVSKENKLPKKMVFESSDWSIVNGDSRENYELLLNDDKQIYFKSTWTGIEYRIGNTVRLNPNTSFSDGKRNFKICSWYISDDPIIKNQFEFVYIITEEGRSIHLDDIIVPH